VIESGINPAINSEGARFMVELRLAQGTAGASIKIGGVVGCKNDCYRPEEALSARESEEFHSWQINQLSSAGVDFLLAATLPNVDEAVGIARAMSATPKPYLISFVIDRRGRVLDGTPLQDAMNRLDDCVLRQPVGFMVGCSHPSFLNASRQPAALFERLVGCQANASSRDHSELDGQDHIQVDDVSEWGTEILALNERYGVRILGGCCGTSVDHLKTLVARRAGLAAG
jgi:homocysteine S-methyltransferase